MYFTDVMRSRYRWPVVFSALAMVYPALGLAFDIMPVNGGLGYDGDRWAHYAQRLARGGIEGLDNRPIDAYTFQKSLVWFVLGGAYWVIGRLVPPFADATQEFNLTVALVSFWIVNSVCLVGAAFLWRAILERLHVTGPAVLLSYVLLFVSVCNLRMPGFYVTIGDVQMTFCGALFLYLFLKSRQRAFLPAGFLSGFVRSGLPEASALLVLFPRRDLPQRRDASRVPGLTIAALATVGIVAVGVRHYDRMMERTLAPDLFWLSILVLCAYVGTALYMLLRGLGLEDLRPRVADLWKAALILLAVTLVLELVAAPSILPLQDFARVAVQAGTYIPAVSLLALVVYFGPGFLLVILLFPRVAAAARRFGPGLPMFLSLGVCLSMWSEARGAVVYVPAFFAIVAVVLAEMRDLSRWGYYAAAALCVAFSKIWLPMAAAESYSRAYSNFPEQLYFMNFGGSMTLQTFTWQAIAALLAGLILGCWVYQGALVRVGTRLRSTNRVPVQER